MLAFGVRLDIDVMEHKRRQTTGGDRQSPRNAEVLPNVDGARSWDLPKAGSLSAGRQVKAERRSFWEQSHWADQWAQLLDRPRRGNSGSAWQEETPAKAETWDDLPQDVQERLHDIKCDLEHTLAKKSSRPKTHRGPASTAAEPAREMPVPKIWDALYDAPWRDSFQNAVQEGKPPGSSQASTGCHSGDPSIAPSPEIISSTPGTARSLTTESDGSSTTLAPQCDDGVFHIVNDPKGKHALLRQGKDASVTISSQRMELPLGLRRVMCAMVPSDPEASLQLSAGQMRKLSGLHNALQTQKQRYSARRAAPVSKRQV